MDMRPMHMERVRTGNFPIAFTAASIKLSIICPDPTFVPTIQLLKPVEQNDRPIMLLKTRELVKTKEMSKGKGRSKYRPAIIEEKGAELFGDVWKNGLQHIPDPNKLDIEMARGVYRRALNQR